MVTVSTQRLLAKLGYEFKDSQLLELALSHRSVGAKNNERLEFLGDSIVNFVIAESLFERFPKLKEGELSQMRAQMVKGKTLAEIAREFELGDYLKLGQGEMKSGGFRRESILADTVEALIGAIYLDSDMLQCRERVLSWYHSRLEAIASKKSHKDAKTTLQEILQAKKKALPVYTLIETSGEDHDQHFQIACEIPGLPNCIGEGGNRRSAEQAAAAAAIELIENSL
ncbi:ribonuclease III [Dasania marina]|uniref:ribonuclease III n=1 Tax=Dasania marina TaxID=471499 RepID=UPI001969FBA6|nr:ribonuclease III [Dasania marina]